MPQNHNPHQNRFAGGVPIPAVDLNAIRNQRLQNRATLAMNIFYRLIERGGDDASGLRKLVNVSFEIAEYFDAKAHDALPEVNEKKIEKAP